MRRKLPNLSLSDMIKGKDVYFDYYKDKCLWYRTQDGWKFPIPIEEAQGGVFLPKHRAIFLMRWMKLHLEEINKSKEES